MSRREARKRRARRARKNVSGTQRKPRLLVFKSAKHIYGQLIDDQQGHTLLSASSLSPAFRERGGKRGGDVEAARLVGQILGETAKGLGIQAVAFDRNGYPYHGRLAALADAVRELGVQF
ncbi:MAG: 50S ribosomal protein L18 [Nitrospinota bacterium]